MATSKESGNEKPNQKAADNEVDDELNDLLDSALADFEEKKEPSKPPEQKKDGAAKGTTSAGGDPISDLFAEEFSDEMAKEFEDAMKQFMANDPAMFQQIEKLAEAAGNSAEGDGQKEFDATLKETLQNLAHNTEGLQDSAEQNMESDMIKMFSGMGLDGGGGGGGMEDGFMPMMQGMMKTLLSKDILYPSLKDISDKYPEWLEKNKETTEEKAYNNYQAQHKIIQEILTAFDEEKTTDTDDVKEKRFNTIMDKMQKMQEYGQPPKEIVGDMAPGLEFDANGVPKFPSTPDACSVM